MTMDQHAGSSERVGHPDSPIHSAVTFIVSRLMEEDKAERNRRMDDLTGMTVVFCSTVILQHLY
jgi:hypothetical protein